MSNESIAFKEMEQGDNIECSRARKTFIYILFFDLHHTLCDKNYYLHFINSGG